MSLLKSYKKDFLNVLTEEEGLVVIVGLKQLDNVEGIPYDSAIKNIRK